MYWQYAEKIILIGSFQITAGVCESSLKQFRSQNNSPENPRTVMQESKGSENLQSFCAFDCEWSVEFTFYKKYFILLSNSVTFFIPVQVAISFVMSYDQVLNSSFYNVIKAYDMYVTLTKIQTKTSVKQYL